VEWFVWLIPITNEVLALSNESLVFDSAIFSINRTATNLANEHNANFDIGERLSISVADFRKVWQAELTRSRDAATLTAAQLQTFVRIGVAIIKTITSKEQSKEVVAYLTRFSLAESPLQLNPIEGFRGVTKAFTNPWILVSEVARQAAEILEKATESDIKKVVEELSKSLVPIAEGCTSVGAALDHYATHIA